MSRSHTASAHEYQGENFSMDCMCTVCRQPVCDHVDQQHYCEDCKGTHWGDHNHCFLGEAVSDELVSKNTGEQR